MNLLEEDLFDGIKSGVVIFGSARTHESEHYYQKARHLANCLAKADISVITGGGGGIMEAANRGAFEAGGASVGFNIFLPKEQKSNSYLTKDITFDHFYQRKLSFVHYAKAFVIFPGGFGTMDELFEMLTLIQTEKIELPPFYIYGTEFWEGLIGWLKEQMLRNGYIDQKDMHIFRLTDDIDGLATSLIQDLGRA